MVDSGMTSEVSIWLCRTHAQRFLRNVYRRTASQKVAVWEESPGQRGWYRRSAHREYYDLIVALIAGEEKLDA